MHFIFDKNVNIVFEYYFMRNVPLSTKMVAYCLVTDRAIFMSKTFFTLLALFWEIALIDSDI